MGGTVKHVKLILIVIFFGMIFGIQQVRAQTEIPSPDKQIIAATSTAPADLRDGAKVLGYNRDGELVTLREGTNELICLADDPKQERFHVACYYKELEPFMVRGRQLRREGKSREEVMETRRQEIDSGKIPWPQKPMALYSLTGSGDGFDYSTGKLRAAGPLYVVYIPYATEESTGIATRPASKGAPWLMDAGKPWAHIMISTGRMVGEDSSEN